jgi:glycosyltransferase involved in cell wall biosynthesis
MNDVLEKPLRIACYGLLSNRQVGSSASANFLILEELLKRGYQIDFYAWKNYNEPTDLLEYNGFSLIYISSNRPWLQSLQSLIQKLPNKLKDVVQGITYELFIHNLAHKDTKKNVTNNHIIEPYNLLLFLNIHAPFKIPGIPVVSWPQGASGANWLYIQKLKDTIISLCGKKLYFKLMVFYYMKERRIRPQMGNSDIMICGSEWSKEQLTTLYCVSSKAVRALPFPVDIDFFRPQDVPSSDKFFHGKRIFLWLGRSEPRKRLDLLLAAYKLLLIERQDVLLKIVGGFSWAEGYKKLIDDFEFPEYIEYLPSIARTKVPELMTQCDFLIQPSEGEDFGTSVAEALCCGLPVIIGPTNGTKDYIGSSSFVFDEYSPQSLKDTMLQAIQFSKQDWEKLSKEARSIAKENFNLPIVTDQLKKIFREVLIYK